jgi:signal transduction histidine kinase
MSEEPNRRILLIDDTASIHEDFRKILTPADTGASEVDAAMAGLLGGANPNNGHAKPAERVPYQMDSALQGPEGLEKLKAANAAGRPYALAFVDVRMPPGWDGVRTIEALWKEDPFVQTVICTAYSDYSWDQTLERLGASERLLILKKPFDAVEIQQVALALTEKWNIARRERELFGQLKRAEQEARAYASSLETVNRALVTAKAATDKVTQLKTEFLLRLSEEVNTNLQRILGEAGNLKSPAQRSAAERDYLDAIISASERLMSTFNETMDLALLEAGELSCETAPCEPAPILEELRAAALEAARRKGIAFELTVRGDVPATIQTDGRRFRQILGELIDNAVQRTEAGTVRVTVGMQLTNDWRRSFLRCDVSDSGPGILEAERGSLFEPFQHRRSTENPGLGLALAKRLAEILGGDLVVSDVVSDAGTTFTLTLDAGTLAEA